MFFLGTCMSLFPSCAVLCWWAKQLSMAGSNQAHYYFMVDLRGKAHNQRGHSAQYSGFTLVTSSFVLSILEWKHDFYFLGFYSNCSKCVYNLEDRSRTFYHSVVLFITLSGNRKRKAESTERVHEDDGTSKLDSLVSVVRQKPFVSAYFNCSHHNRSEGNLFQFYKVAINIVILNIVFRCPK